MPIEHLRLQHEHNPTCISADQLRIFKILGLKPHFIKISLNI